MRRWTAQRIRACSWLQVRVLFPQILFYDANPSHRRRPLPAATDGHTSPRFSMDLMVNQSFANRYFSGRSIVGQRLSWDSGIFNGRVTGVVGDARELGIDNDPAPTVYACDSAPSPFPWYLVRTTGDTRTTPGIIRQRLKEIEPLRSVYAVAPLEEQIGAAYSQTKWRAVLLALFAATALFLSCLRRV